MTLLNFSSVAGASCITEMRLGLFLATLASCLTLYSCLSQARRFIMRYEENIEKAVGTNRKSNNALQDAPIGDSQIIDTNTKLIRRQRDAGK